VAEGVKWLPNEYRALSSKLSTGKTKAIFEGGRITASSVRDGIS
jgi:hypothetical protein